MIGASIGHYRIVAKLGAGAMGEVYRARDTRLARDVAIKVLPATLADDADRRERLAREARLLASLSHPHIAVVHGLEECDGVLAIVLECVDGPTLAERIAAGPLPPAPALALAAQIVDALDAAHERGIVHRDLKPANIKVTAQDDVKVLDFGLAMIDAAHHAAGSMAPTLTSAGTVVGTVAYMSPEQARGQVVDKRTDIWAFGCILFEMVAGSAPFSGQTSSDTLVAILEREPDWSKLPAGLPVGARRLIELCLRKDRRSRLRDIGDARLVLDDDTDRSPRQAPSTHGSGRSSKWLAPAACMLALMVGAASAWLVRGVSSTTAEQPSRFLIDVRPADALLGPHALERSASGRSRPSRTAIALSPDGRTIVFAGVRDGQVRLYARALDAADAVAIGGTDGADAPMFSPDGRWIAFWSAGAIRKVPVAGGTAVKLCDSTPTYGAQWTADDRILFAQRSGIWRVSAAGGQPEAITKPEQGDGEARHLLPNMAPHGNALIYTVQRSVNDWETSRIVAQPLDGGARKTLVENAADGRYAEGHLLYMRLGMLMAAPFDPARVAITGGEFEVARDVMQSVNSTAPYGLDTGGGQFAISASGTLVFVAGGPQRDAVNELQWIGRDGRVEPIALPPPSRAYFLPRISPDGRFIAVGTLGLRDQNLWKYDIAQGTLTRLTFEGRTEQAVWSRDGSRIAFASTLKGTQNVYVARSDAVGPAEPLTTGRSVQFPGSWTPDSRQLVLTNGDDIAAVAVDTRTLTPVITSPFVERMPALSPDGRWLAYVSNETGRPEVYVRGFPKSDSKAAVSVDGGTQPVWARDGRRLFYLASAARGSGAVVRMIEVDVTTEGAFVTRARRQLFELDASHYGDAAQASTFDVTPDGQRFVFAREAFLPQAVPREIEVVRQWLANLKPRASAP